LSFIINYVQICVLGGHKTGGHTPVAGFFICGMMGRFGEGETNE